MGTYDIAGQIDAKRTDREQRKKPCALQRRHQSSTLGYDHGTRKAGD